MIRSIAKIYLTVLIIICLIVNIFSWDATLMNFDKILSAPDSSAIFGYDDYGRNIANRIFVGFFASLKVVLISVFFSFLFGVFFGLISGYFGNWLDKFFLFVCTIFQAFPNMLLIIAVAAFMGPGLYNLIFALTITSWVGLAKIARAEALKLKNLDFIYAAKIMGANELFILKKHFFKNTFTPLRVELNYLFANLIIAEAGLSFLGIGQTGEQPSWGNMLRDSIDYLIVGPHYTLSVSFFMTYLILSINSLSE